MNRRKDSDFINRVVRWNNNQEPRVSVKRKASPVKTNPNYTFEPIPDKYKNNGFNIPDDDDETEEDNFDSYEEDDGTSFGPQREKEKERQDLMMRQEMMRRQYMMRQGRRMSKKSDEMMNEFANNAEELDRINDKAVLDCRPTVNANVNIENINPEKYKQIEYRPTVNINARFKERGEIQKDDPRNRVVRNNQNKVNTGFLIPGEYEENERRGNKNKEIKKKRVKQDERKEEKSNFGKSYFSDKPVIDHQKKIENDIQVPENLDLRNVLDHLLSKPDVPVEMILAIVNNFKKLMDKKRTIPVSQCVSGKYIVIGRLNGSIAHLREILKDQLKDITSGNVNIVFLGDYTGCVQYGINVILAAMTLQCIDPKKIICLRGKRESPNIKIDINAMPGELRDECVKRYGQQAEKVYNCIRESYAYFNTAVIINDTFFVNGNLPDPCFFGDLCDHLNGKKILPGANLDSVSMSMIWNSYCFKEGSEMANTKYLFKITENSGKAIYTEHLLVQTAFGILKQLNLRKLVTTMDFNEIKLEVPDFYYAVTTSRQQNLCLLPGIGFIYVVTKFNPTSGTETQISVIENKQYTIR